MVHKAKESVYVASCCLIQGLESVVRDSDFLKSQQDCLIKTQNLFSTTKQKKPREDSFCCFFSNDASG